MEQGKVKWYDVPKAYGFIIRERGADVFFHRSHIIGGELPPLQEGQAVSFEVVEGPKGLQAINVTRMT